jgi:hypothetical protein
MRVIISGDRYWNCPELAARVVERQIARYGRQGLTIVPGADVGIDAAFARAATLAEVEQEPHPIDRQSFGLRRSGTGRSSPRAPTYVSACTDSSCSARGTGIVPVRRWPRESRRG